MMSERVMDNILSVFVSATLPRTTAIAYTEVISWANSLARCEPEKRNAVVWATIGEFAVA